MELLRSCSILDTSNIKIRHSFFLEECRSKFNSIPFQFDSVNDLQAYWFKLKSVCLMTKIFKPRGDELPDDEGALHLIGGSRRLSKDYNKLGFGAGGVVPLMYSHLLYNWGTMTFFKSEEDFQDLTTDDEPILPEITYTDLPIVPPDDLTDEAKRQPLYEMGGRSRQKRKLDGISTTVSAAKRVKKAASQKVHKKKTNLNSKEKRSRVRTTLLVWSKKEDAVLMRCHVALCVLNAHHLPVPTPFEMCGIIHDFIVPNRLKKANTVHKHMSDICSRDSTVHDLLKKCVDQLQHAIQMGCGPPLNFRSLLHYLIDNYSGCVPTLIATATSPRASPTVSLPATLQELELCEVCTPHEAGPFLPPVRTVSDVRKSMLIDLIIAVMGAGSDCYNEYTAFHLFEEYLEQELEDAVALMRSALLVKHWKACNKKIKKHLGPSATQTLVLHNNFYSRLESSFPSHLFEDIYTHLTSLSSASTESAPKEGDWTSGAEMAVKLHTLAGCNYFCSSAVDTYISNLVNTSLTV